jgi:SAM-dependent methyltransferase
MFESFRQRSYELEHLDLGDYTPEEYEGCMVELRRVNRWLGDAWALGRSVLPEIGRDGASAFSLLDVGAGTGELLRQVARWARGRGLRARLVGLELNERAALGIREESRGFAEIAAVRGDALRLPFADAAFDYAMCSLFTHHFRDEEAVAVLGEMSRVATVGRLFLHNRLVREDGALSILRGFVPRELRRLAERAGLTRAKVERRFPYRLVLSGSK